MRSCTALPDALTSTLRTGCTGCLTLSLHPKVSPTPSSSALLIPLQALNLWPSAGAERCLTLKVREGSVRPYLSPGADNGTGLAEERRAKGERAMKDRAMSAAGSQGAPGAGYDMFIAKPPEGMDSPPPYIVTKRVGVGNSGEAKHYPWRFVVTGTGPSKMKVDYPE